MAFTFPEPFAKTTTTSFLSSPLPSRRLPHKISFSLYGINAASLADRRNQDNRYNSEGPKPPSSVEELLRIYSYGERIIKLDFDGSDGHLVGQRVISSPGTANEESFVLNSEEGILAEIQDRGSSKICRILGIRTKTSKKKGAKAHEDTTGNTRNLIRPPRLEVALVGGSDGDDTTADPKGSKKTIDIGQLTTIWPLSGEKYFEREPSLLSSSKAAVCEKVLQILPVNHVEDVFENRYKYHVGRGRNIHGGGTLTKKQVEMISAAASIAASSSISTFKHTEELRRIIDLILKQCLRCGSKYTRLLDSVTLEESMFYDEVEGTFTQDYTSGSNTTLQERWMFCATALSEDNDTAGRFKRMPCLWLPPPVSGNHKGFAPSSSNSTTTLTLVNGGWVVVDQSVRAAAEGRKFAASAMSLGGSLTNDSNDERILCRLESLACGEKLHQQKRGGANIRLEVDVRTTLEAMKLPLSSEGAQEALIRIGRWTKKESNGRDRKGKVLYERWSPSVLDAAKWYSQMDRVRRRNMKSKILELRAREQSQMQQKKLKKTPSPAVLEGRIDLTSLPCICIDAERTSFRDDALGIRKRSSTGRKVNKKASQWELLFHIADVSDIYAPHPTLVDNSSNSCTTRGHQAYSNISIKEQKKYLNELAKAARSRIRSEYNLPLGPLHLLPTTVLDSLSLDVFKQDWTSNPNTWPTSWHTLDEVNGAVNRAVTLWVYINERNGSVIDIGFERSIISRPLALTFETTTKLLEASEEQQEKLPPMLAKARVLLSVVERNIELWSDERQKKSNEARAREEKLAARELISDQVFGGGNNRRRRRDDGRDGDFRRNRGHRLVDSTLHLYENAFRLMMQRHKAMVPQHPLSSNKKYGSIRSATAPLRYYLQGLAQRQALAVLCKYGGPPIPNDECKNIGRTITSVYNTRLNSGGATKGPQVAPPRQLAAIRSLKSHLKKHSSSKNRVIPAISTGKNSEVVIQGVGVVAFCKEIPGTIKPGVKIMVRILQFDDENGKVVVALHNQN